MPAAKKEVLKEEAKGNIRKLYGAEHITTYVKRSSLKEAPWNPEIRIQLRELTSLRDSMEEDGFWDFMPIICDRHGMIVDGHRRNAVARLLHIDEVPVIVVDMEAGELWARLNGTRAEVTGSQALQAISNGLTTWPPKFAKQIAQLQEVLGEEQLMELGRRGKSPHIINPAKRIARYCGLQDDKPFIGITVMWLVNHDNMSTLSIRAIREQVSANVLERAIRGDRALEPAYG